MKKSLQMIALLLAASSTLAAQAQTIGSLPDKSPLLDLNDGMRFGLVGGFLLTGHDAVGVGPKSTPIVGVRYDLPVGGPMYLSAVVFGGSTTRTILDYTRSASTRDIGTQATGIVVANISAALSLTGPRSWHGLQPLVNVGLGIASAPGDKPDVSGYSMGTAFSFSYGLGLRWATGHFSELRLDLNQYWWDLKYPDLYRSTQGDPVAIRATGSLSSYTANTALTLAWSIKRFW